MVAHFRPVACALALAVVAPPAAARAPLGPLPPSADELWDAQVDAAHAYRPQLSEPRWVVPSSGLPSGVRPQSANNNLSIALYRGRLFLAWRSAPTHFASAQARLHVVSSADLGRSWSLETEVALGRDLREPLLIEIAGRLRLYFVSLGENLYAFEPGGLWRMERLAGGDWTVPEVWGGPEEVTWDAKVRRGRVWMTSYHGKHYDLRTTPIVARFRSSLDGLRWDGVGAPAGDVYRGGVTETAFEFDREGRLWGVTRNEDGDRTGFGSHVVEAPSHAPGRWSFPERSAPLRYDSPRMFRHGDDLYLVARRDLGPPIGARFGWLPPGLRKLLLWPLYSLRPKRTALYRLDTAARRFEPLVDLASAGDTAFPSVARLGPHEFLIANYSSPPEDADRSWLYGQLKPTGIYLARLRFVRS